MSKRKDTALALKDATISYWLKKGYSTHIELSVTPWGKNIADAISLNLKGKIVITEIKSCPADYRTDKKWHTYLPFCNKFYFCLTEQTYDRLKGEILEQRKKHEGAIGVKVLDSNTGYLKVVVPSKERKIKKSVKHELFIRLAWRGGQSKRTRRRKRNFLDSQQ